MSERTPRADGPLPAAPEASAAGIDGAAVPRARVAADEIVARVAAAASEATVPARGFTEGFRALCAELDPVHAMIDVSLGGSMVEDQHHAGPGDPEFWREPLAQVANEAIAAAAPRHRTYRKSDDGTTIVLAAAPVPHGGRRTAGVVALVTEVARPGQASARSALLGLAAVAIGRASSSVPPAQRPRAPVPGVLAEDGVPDDPDRLAIDLVNRLRARLDLVQVALGGVRGRRVRVLGISGLEQVRSRSPGVRRIQAAMEECLDADRPLVAQRDAAPGEAARAAEGHRLHGRWNQETGDPVASIPLRVHGEVRAVLSVRAHDLVTAERIEEILRHAGPIPAAIELVERASRSLSRHALETVGREVRAAVSPRGMLRRVAIAAALGLAAWIAFGSMNFAVTLPGRVQPVEMRTATAPFAGRLAEVFVRPGDHVAAGQALFRLDDAESRLEVARLEAEVAREETAAEIALSEGDAVESRLARARAAVLSAQLAEARARVEAAVVRSVRSGTVSEGDAARQVGRRVERGEEILQVASGGAWALELDVPETRLRHLHEAATGTFLAHARPDRDLPVHLVRLGAGTVDRDGRRVLPAEASIDEPADWLRPGLEGAVRLELGRRPTWWVLSHRAVDAVQRTTGP